MNQVILITGKAGAGKTTLATSLAKNIDAVLLDSDAIRAIYPTGFSDQDREQHLFRMASLAALIREQGNNVIIAAIMPKKSWRQMMLEKVPGAALIHIPGGTLWPGTEYEEPGEDENPLSLYQMKNLRNLVC